MAMQLFDLAGADEAIRFSPYCWRVKMALAHKGLKAEHSAWHFTEKDRIAFSGHQKVPVLCDGDTTLGDSWLILQYLDETYPDKPLFAASPASLLFFRHWVERSVQPLLFRCVVADIHSLLTDEDQSYFRTTREQMLGSSLEAVQAEKNEHRRALQTVLEPIRATLSEQDFMCGAQPTAADYLLFGAFQWCRNVSEFQLLPEASAVFDWRERLLDLHGGYARSAKGFEVFGAQM